MEKTILISLPIEDLQTVIIDCVNTCLKSSKQEVHQQAETDELLTVQDAAKFLSLSVPTVYGLISKGELPVMKRSKRCYFSRVELFDYLKQGRRKTLAETAIEAERYCKTKKG
jgi:excisionase family DNA binding protein